MPKPRFLAKPTGIFNITAIAALAIICLVPFQAILTTWIGSNTGHLDLVRIWKEILMAAMLPIVLFGLWQKPEARIILKDKLLWLFAIYVALHLVLGWYSLAQHRVNAPSLIYALLINLRFIGFFFICYLLAWWVPSLKDRWLSVLVIPAAAVIIFGLAQQFILPYDFLKHFGYGPATIPAYQTVDSDINYQRIQSTLRGANPLGAYLVIVLPAAVLAFRAKWRIALTAGALATLFYSYSRGAWIGAFCAIVFLAVWKMKGTRRFKELAIASAVLLALVGLAAYSLRSSQTAENTIFHTNSKSTTGSPNQKHLASLKEGYSDVVHQPLGDGPGTAGPASFRNTGHQPRIAEDYYLQIGQEVGLAGMLLFISMVGLVGARLWARRSELPAQILLSSLLGISLINLVSHAWSDDTLSLIWWGLAGISLAPVILKTRQKAYGKTKKTAA